MVPINCEEDSLSARFGRQAPLPTELLHHAFEARAQTHPDIRAIEFENQWLSYGQLNDQANTLAHAMSSLNIPAKARVAVIMDRCLEFPIGLLAVLKVSGVMVPIDESFPLTRISFMLSDAGVQAVLATKRHRKRISELDLSIPVLSFDSKQLADVPNTFQPTQNNLMTRHDEAYVVYTSGSTGKPKGVPVLHEGVLNAISFPSTSDMGYIEGARVMQFMAIGFDACQWETWTTLSAGATLVLRSGDDLSTFSKVDVIFTTPTGLAMLGNPLKHPNLKCVCVGGEALPASLKDLWCPHVRLFNCYGPSECSILTHMEEMSLDSPVTIGLPINNVNCYILDESMKSVPYGIAGEIFLGGLCVASRYINLPDLTKVRFLNDPFVDGCMYRTGDFGIMLPNGKVVCLGRSDSQVKLKGYRIELDEIAAAMMQHPHVTTAAVIVKDKSHLIGFFSPSDVDVESLHITVSALLPLYMVPAVWMGLDSLPTNANGKIDKNALQDMNVAVQICDLASDLERQMAGLWAQVLGVAVCDIGRTSSFFALGGDSISAIRLVSKAKSSGILLSSAQVLKNPRLANMVGVAKRTTLENCNFPLHDAPVDGEVLLTPVQYFNFEHAWKNVHFWNQSVLLKSQRLLTLGETRGCFSQLVERHDMLRARFRFSAENGWTQYILPASNSMAVNVEYIQLDHMDLLDNAILAKEKSFNLVDGPVYAVTLFSFPDSTQYVHIAIHHTLVDLVSYRVLVDELQLLLSNLPLGQKTTPFKEWSERLTAQSKHWDTTPWAPYMINDTCSPPTRPSSKVLSSGFLRQEITSKLDSANEIYGTNIQELALSALTMAYAELLFPENIDSCKLPLMLEGHGRESWASDIDISNTVGWFTSIYPIVCSATRNISKLIRQLKQNIRAVPHGGLSYGAIKYLAPAEAHTLMIKNHKHHNFMFNYAGRFQEMSAKSNLFETVCSVQDVIGPDEDDFIPGNIYLHHEGADLVLDVSVADWQLSNSQVELWISLWCDWMGRIVDHCLDPATIGGRTASDVPLVGFAVDMVETEILTTLGLWPLDVEDIYPVTPLQEGLLVATSQDPSEYVLQSTFDLPQNIDFHYFMRLWKQLAQEEPLLRSVVVSTRDGFFQAVAKEDYSEWSIAEDLIWPFEEIQSRTLEYFQQDRSRGFLLNSKSYNRFVGFRVSDGSTRVIWTTHHAFMDGWSCDIIVKNLKGIHDGRKYRGSSTSFKDYISWLSTLSSSTSERFWSDNLEKINEVEHLSLPAPFVQKETTQKRKLNNRLVSGVNEVCEALQVTPFAIFQAAWSITLQQYTRSEYISFGSVVSGRDIDLDGVESIVGVLINTIPVLVHVPQHFEVKQLIHSLHLKNSIVGPYSQARLLDIKRWANCKKELFDTIFTFGNYRSPIDGSGDSSDSLFQFQEGQEYVDTTIGIDVCPIDGHYRIEISHNATNVDDDVMELFCDRFTAIISKLANIQYLNIPISGLDEAPRAENMIIRNSSYGISIPLANELLHDRFEELAISHPELRAIEFENEWLSYGELNSRANAVARDLASMGVCIGSRVAVVMERCLEFPIGLLAALKVGAATVPLDASFPVNRLSYILSDSGVSVVVTTDAYKNHMDRIKLSGDVLYINCKSVSPISNDDFQQSGKLLSGSNEAFIVYTSGSTGKPKGVPVLHRSAVNVIMFQLSNFSIQPGMRVLQFMAIGFDGCQWEIWKALSHGATLVFRGQNTLESLLSVDVLSCTPTALAQLGHPRQYPKLKYVAVGGEALSLQLKDLWVQHVCLSNCYGPSECAIETHVWPLNLDFPVTVGSPIPNVNSYILDENKRRVPVGAVGELYLGGICVSPGYINLADQTSERFLQDPFSSSDGQMFRTGDLARLHSNGHYEILGRQDSQVKLKGYRIELDEVANAIMCHPQVVAAAAIVKNKSHLVGFFSPANVNIFELEDVVASNLPVYMVPAIWGGLDSMPENANGKIDKNALETLDLHMRNEVLETETEEQIASIWAQVLDVGIAGIGRQTSFIAIGGDSLSAIKVVAVCKDVGMQISATQLLKTSVLWRVAASVTNVTTNMIWPTASLPQDIVNSIVNQNSSIPDIVNCTVYPATPLQAGMVYETTSNPSSYIMQIPIRMKRMSDMAKFCNAFQQIARKRDILRTTFVTSTLGIYQVIHPTMDKFVIANASNMNMDEFLRLDYDRGFTIGDAYFVRLTTVADEYIVLTIHHALYDGWAIPMLMSDLCDAIHGNALIHRPSFCKVVDYINAQDKEATEAFWRQYLSGSEPSVVGTHRGNQSPNEHNGNPLSIVSQLKLAEITTAARSANLTVAELTKLAWANTLRKYTRQNDVVFGLVMANRDIPVPDAGKILGPLLSTVPCRIKFDDAMTVQQWIDFVNSERGVVVSHSHASLLDVKRWSGVEGELFDTLFVFQNLPEENGSSDFEFVEYGNESRFDTGHAFDLIVSPTGDKLLIKSNYDPERLDYDLAKWMLSEYDYSICQMIEVLGSTIPMSNLWALSQSQLDVVQAASFGPEVPLKYELLHLAFEDWAVSHPAIRAVEYENEWLSYGELNAKASALACELVDMGVHVGSRVAVIMERCLEFPIGLLATLKAGAAMVPLDASFPVNRLAYILSDADVS
ncbi:hypothetical protein As57867_019407, partial [Aphanomyces stellatus]